MLNATMVILMVSSLSVSALAFPQWRRPRLVRLIGEARRRQRRRQVTITGSVLLVIAVAASLYVSLAGQGSDPSAAVGNGALGQTPAGSTGFPPPIADALHSGYLPVAGPMTLADGSLWVKTPDRASVVCTFCTADPARATVSRVDPNSERVVASITVGPRGGGDLTAGFGSIWAIDRAAGTVTRIDPQTNTVTATIATGTAPSALTTGATGIWVADDGQASTSGASLVEIDPATNRVSTRLPLTDPPVWLAGTAGSIWVADPARHAILRVDPATAKPTDSIPSSLVGPGSHAAVDGHGDLWLSSGGGRPRLARLDPATHTITTVLTEAAVARDRLQGIDALTYGHGSIWLSGYCGQGTIRVLEGGPVYCLLEVNPASNQVELTRALPFGNPGREPERANAALAYDGRTLWFSFYGAWNVQPIDPRLVVVCGPYKWHGAGVFAADCHTKKP